MEISGFFFIFLNKKYNLFFINFLLFLSLIQVEGIDQHEPSVKFNLCPFISIFSNFLSFIQKKGNFLKLWCSFSFKLNSLLNLVMFLVRKIEYEIKKIIEIFFKQLFFEKLILFAKNVEYGKMNKKNTIIYPAYLRVGKLKNHNKNININKQ